MHEITVVRRDVARRMQKSGLTYREIAKVLKVSQPYAWQLVNLGKKRKH
jgi:predicted transcriptional regulator